MSDVGNEDQHARYKRYIESNDSDSLEDVLNGFSVNGM